MKIEEKIIQLLQQETGFNPELAESPAVLREINRLVSKSSNPENFLNISGKEWKLLLDGILNPETWFFRNPQSFDALVRWINENPLLLNNNPLQILSIPCSSGEEPYSIAITLLEHGFNPEKFKITAGDISEKSLKKAEDGIYGPNSFRENFNKSIYRRYFQEIPPGRKKIAEKIRERTVFSKINLIKGPIPEAHVIFCRNVLIYFNEKCQKRVLDLLWNALPYGGCLFLGSSELPAAIRAGFRAFSHPMSFACIKEEQNQKEIKKAPLSSRRKNEINAGKSFFSGSRSMRKPLSGKKSPGNTEKVFRNGTKKSADENIHNLIGKTVDMNSPGTSVVSLEKIRETADLGLLEEAASMIVELMKHNEPQPEIYCLRGTIFEAMGKYDDAEQSYRKALYLNPEHTESLMQLGMMLEIKGRIQEAESFLRRAKRNLEL